MSEQLRKLHRLSMTCFDVTLTEGENGCRRFNSRYLKMLLSGSWISSANASKVHEACDAGGNRLTDTMHISTVNLLI
ncbi:hypothetical protein FTO68_03045 [Methanocalculus taiwanensis]|uniref:Uncharacterized protein n=1 Tax=Methanocalculus taiwanensis TaxID=106207 RepID=A0ABD4TGV6_9EURY|nr:hypothetical protein [Methanocalculus taiwanensis]MCQ1537966.1 hypothetical protein [Methanocalculus taiwanensis]